MKFAIYQDSRQGGRKYNQDRIAHSYSREALLMVVADGMGGHYHGEIAAQITVEVLVTLFQKHAHPELENPWQFLRTAIMQAHQAILGYANSRGMPETPRTTCVVAVVQHGIAYWAHVGDSRLYVFRGGSCLHRTTDHSRVQQMVDDGLITAEIAETHADRNKIYNCLGSQMAPMIDLGGKVQIQEHDTLLLCTDGVWGEVRLPELSQMISQESIDIALPKIMALAEKNGGEHADNLSAVAINWLGLDDGQMMDEGISTLALSFDDFAGQMPTLEKARILNEADGEVSEEDIERAIAEINAALKRYQS